MGDSAGAARDHHRAAHEHRQAREQQHHGQPADDAADVVGRGRHAPLALSPQPLCGRHELVLGQVVRLVEVRRGDGEPLPGVGPRRLDQAGIAHETLVEDGEVVAVGSGGDQPGVGERLRGRRHVGVVLLAALTVFEAAGDEGAGRTRVGCRERGVEVGHGRRQVEALLAGVSDDPGVAVGHPSRRQPAERERARGDQRQGHEQSTSGQWYPPGRALDAVEQAPSWHLRLGSGGHRGRR